MRIKSRSKPRREEKGFSLIYVMSIGAIAVLAALAITDSLIAVNRSAASQVYMNEASSAAENGIQYALAYVNNFVGQGGNPNSLPAQIAVPPAMTNGATVIVYLTALGPVAMGSNLYNSPIYNPIFWPQNNAALSNGTLITIQPDYREMKAVATYNTFQRTLSAIIASNFNSTTSPLPQTPLFVDAIATNNILNIQGTSVMLDPTYVVPSGTNPYANTIISSNQQINITGTNPVTIGGSVNAFNPSSTGTGSLSVPMINNGNPSLTIDGNVSFSTNTPAALTPSYLIPDNSSGGSTANVLGDGANGGLVLGNIATSISPTTIAPAPSVAANQSAQQVAVNQNTSSISAPTSVNGTPGIADLGSVNLTSIEQQNVSISPGQYVTNSLNLGSNSTLELSSAGAGGQAVQLYVQGDAAGGSPINISGSLSGISNSSNLQIFYNGSQTVNISSPNFYGLIYAPNATVNVSTASGPFHGAVVANTMTVSGAQPFYFDPSSVLTTGGNKTTAAGPGYVPSSTPQSYSLLSWQESTN